MSHVLVTGATGYVGSRLVPALLEAGHDVRVAMRRPEAAARHWWQDRVEVVRADVMDPDSISAATEGVQAVYYLVHALEGSDFMLRDKVGAENVAAAIDANGVERVVYLSGIVPAVDRDELSDHIWSRLEVEETLARSQASAIALRAAVILGGGSTSFEIIRQIAQRLPVHAVPTWMAAKVQPVSAADVLAIMVAALDQPASVQGAFDVGGHEQLPYRDLLRTYSRVAGLLRIQVPLPSVPSDVVGLLAGQVTDAPAGTVRSLVESLHHDMVAGDDAGRGVDAWLPEDHAYLDLETAIRRALGPATDSAPGADPMVAWSTDPDWADGGYTLLQRVRRTVPSWGRG